VLFSAQHLPLAKAIANALPLSEGLKIPEGASRLGSRAAIQHKKAAQDLVPRSTDLKI
jgi:hypothetical protein